MALEQLSGGAGKRETRAGRWAMTDATDRLVLGVEVEDHVFGGFGVDEVEHRWYSS